MMSIFSLFQTAERTSRQVSANNYIFQRHLFAYKQIDVHSLANQHVLELGSGDGYGMKLLAPHALTYLAIDKTEPLPFFIKPGTAFMKASLPCLKYIPNDSFDTILCFQVIEHIRNDHHLLSEIRRVLRPGGLLQLSTPNRLSTLSKNPYHIREYSPLEMRALIAAHFSQADISGIYGNQTVMDYYAANKQSVERFRRYDVFGLETRLPSWMLRLPYNLLNNINRCRLAQKDNIPGGSINWDDFYTAPQEAHCLDYLVIAQK